MTWVGRSRSRPASAYYGPWVMRGDAVLLPGARKFQCQPYGKQRCPQCDESGDARANPRDVQRGCDDERTDGAEDEPHVGSGDEIQFTHLSQRFQRARRLV